MISDCQGGPWWPYLVSLSILNTVFLKSSLHCLYRVWNVKNSKQKGACGQPCLNDLPLKSPTHRNKAPTPSLLKTLPEAMKGAIYPVFHISIFLGEMVGQA